MRQVGGRQHKVTVRLSTPEYEGVVARAAAARLSLASYLAAAGQEDRAGRGLGVSERRAVAAELFGARRVLMRAAENLNRLTRIAQAQGRVPPEVPAAAGAVMGYAARHWAAAQAIDPRLAAGHPEVGESGDIGEGEWSRRDPT